MASVRDRDWLAVCAVKVELCSEPRIPSWLPLRTLTAPTLTRTAPAFQQIEIHETLQRVAQRPGVVKTGSGVTLKR